LDDLVGEAISAAVDKAAYPTHLNNLDGQALDDRYATMLAAEATDAPRAMRRSERQHA
jgi:hypothetical protein